MHPLGIFSSVLLALLLVSLAGVYYVPAMRDAAVQVLAKDDAALAQERFIKAAGQTAGVVRSGSGTSSDDTIYHYRLLKNVDECTFNKMGQDGWEAVQMGGNVDVSSGKSPDCKSTGIVDTMDWVLFLDR